MELKQIDYDSLNAQQRKQYNFQKVSAPLADYGFACLKLDDSLEDADFLAQHFDDISFKKIQLKGRLNFEKRYIGKNIYVAFPYHKDWYLIDHDKVLSIFLETFKDAMAVSKSWAVKGIYNWPSLSHQILKILEPFKLKLKK